MAGRGGRMRVPQQGVAILRPHGGGRAAAAASMVVAPPPIIEQKLAAQHLEIQRLLTENQRFAATHVALRQEVAQLRQLVSQNEARLAALESDVEQARSDAKAVNAHRQDLVVQVTQLTQDLHRARLDAQQMLVLRAENDTLRQELQRLKATYEPKGGGGAGGGSGAAKDHAELSKEVEKLRAAVSFPSSPSVSAASATPSMVTYHPSTATTVSYPVAAPFAVANGGVGASTPAGETWTTHFAPNGALFYYNTVTGATQWEKPASLQQQQQQQLHSAPPAPMIQQTMQQVLVHHQQQQQQAAAAAAAAASYQLAGHQQQQFPQQLLYVPQQPSAPPSANIPGRMQPSPSQNPLTFLARSSLAASGVVNPASKHDGISSQRSPSGANSPSLPSRPQGATLSVYGISSDYRDSDLVDLFKPYGSVLYAKVATAKEMAAGQPCGTVTMDSRRSAEAAMAAMNGVSISGCALEIKLQRDQDTDFPSKQKTGAYRSSY